MPFGMHFIYTILRYSEKNPATGGDTLSPHFWFQVFYNFYSSDFLLHNWNLLGRIYLLTKVIGILGVFFIVRGLDFLNGQNIFFIY